MIQIQASAQAAILDFLLVTGNAHKPLLQIAVLSSIILEIALNARQIAILVMANVLQLIHNVLPLALKLLLVLTAIQAILF